MGGEKRMRGGRGVEGVVGAVEGGMRREWREG